MRERNKQFSFRLYQSELNKIKAKAKKCGLAVSEYIRNCALDRKVMEAPTKEFQSVYKIIGDVRLELLEYDGTNMYTDKLKTAQDLLLDLYHGKGGKDIGNNQNMADQRWNVASHRIRKES